MSSLTLLKFINPDFFPYIHKSLAIGAMSPIRSSEVRRVAPGKQRLRIFCRSAIPDGHENDLNLFQIQQKRDSPC